MITLHILTNLASKITPVNEHFTDYMKSPNLSSIVLLPTDEAEIELIVRNLKNKPSFGYDGIGLDIMKKSIKSILTPIIS